jgi:hypothetical protein
LGGNAGVAAGQIEADKAIDAPDLKDAKALLDELS